MLDEICTRSYGFNHPKFDTRDVSGSIKHRGSMHGPVKIYNKDEIAEMNHNLEMNRNIGKK